MHEEIKAPESLVTLSKERSINVENLINRINKIKNEKKVSKDVKDDRKACRDMLYLWIENASFNHSEKDAVIFWVNLCMDLEGGLLSTQKSIDSSAFVNATNRYIDARIDTGIFNPNARVDCRFIPSLDNQVLTNKITALDEGISSDILRASALSGILDFLNITFSYDGKLQTTQSLIRSGVIDVGITLPESSNDIDPHGLEKMLVMPVTGGGYTGFIPVRPSAQVLAAHLSFHLAQEKARDAVLREYSNDPTSITFKEPVFNAYINNATNAGALMNTIAGTSLYPVITLPWSSRGGSRLGKQQFHSFYTSIVNDDLSHSVQLLVRFRSKILLKGIRQSIYAAQQYQKIDASTSPSVNAHLYELLYARGVELGASLNSIIIDSKSDSAVRSWLNKNDLNNSVSVDSINHQIDERFGYSKDKKSIWRDEVVKAVFNSKQPLPAVNDQHLDVYIEGLLDGFYQRSALNKQVNASDTLSKKASSHEDRTRCIDGAYLAIQITASDVDLHSNSVSAGMLSMTSIYGLLHNVLQRQSGLFERGFEFLPIYHKVIGQLSNKHYMDDVRHVNNSGAWSYSPMFRKKSFPFSTASPSLYGTAGKPQPLLTEMRGLVELTLLIKGRGDSLSLPVSMLDDLKDKFNASRLSGGIISQAKAFILKKDVLPSGYVLKDVSEELGDSNWLTKMHLSSMLWVDSEKGQLVPIRNLTSLQESQMVLKAPFGTVLVGYEVIDGLDVVEKHYKGTKMPYRWALPMYTPMSYQSTRYIQRSSLNLPWVRVEESSQSKFELVTQ